MTCNRRFYSCYTINITFYVVDLHKYYICHYSTLIHFINIIKGNIHLLVLTFCQQLYTYLPVSIIGERERANLVLQLGRGVVIYIYIYVISYVVGARQEFTT